jgi:N-acetylglutamate synthase-like GNAT family acetyltransferase
MSLQMGVEDGCKRRRTRHRAHLPNGSVFELPMVAVLPIIRPRCAGHRRSPVMTYHVRAAAEQDVDAVLALRRHAEDWLREAGIEQWTKSDYGARVIKG